MAAKGLTECWREAEAAKPSTWKVRGVALGPREADPAIDGATWVAWATGPKDKRLHGAGDSPQDALVQLALGLREVKG